MIKKLVISFLVLFSISWTGYSQKDSSDYKLEFDTPYNNLLNVDKKKYPIVNSNVKRVPSDSIVYMIDGKFYSGREINGMTDQQLEAWKKDIKSIVVEHNKEAIDSTLKNRFKTMIIIQLKDPNK
ncbi:MAG: hypothetical protein ACOYXT_21090 [Bacteroidota bacterium]